MFLVSVVNLAINVTKLMNVPTSFLIDTRRIVERQNVEHGCFEPHRVTIERLFVGISRPIRILIELL
jgi:hypothetical protein